MELPESGELTSWLVKYGSLSLFVLLLLGIVALPVPEETLMVIAGTLMHKEKLDILPTILAALFGSICGITGSYLIGRTLGVYFIHRYGAWVGITEARLNYAHQWFEKYGKWSLVIGYFIPGIRHFTGIIAGTTYLNYKEFATYAYLGAFFWVSTFLSIGYFFGSYWAKIFDLIEANLDILITGAIILTVIAALYYIYKKLK